MRILHTMIRVGNLEDSIQFYTEALGMSVLRQKEMPHGKFTLVFLGYGDETEQAVIELTYNWGRLEYDHGDAYGHIAIEVDDIYAACAHVQKLGHDVPRPPGPMKGSTTVLAFVKDPDGYAIELIQNKSVELSAP